GDRSRSRPKRGTGRIESGASTHNAASSTAKRGPCGLAGGRRAFGVCVPGGLSDRISAPLTESRSTTPVQGGNMRLPCLLLIGTCLAAAAAGEARACPDPGPAKSVASLRPASASRLLAWRPRAWSIASHARATGLRVSIDPVDRAYGMPAGDALSASAVVPDDAP